MPAARSCHYCGAPAGTRDHVVPRSRASTAGRCSPLNVVPACEACNQFKADHRSTCDCPVCRTAWDSYGPPGWSELPRVDPAGWELTARRFRRQQERGELHVVWTTESQGGTL